MFYDSIVLGAGAGGLFFAAYPQISRLLNRNSGGAGGRAEGRVLVLERQNRAGRKLLLSGGGKCNLTNRRVSPDNYLIASSYEAALASGKAVVPGRLASFCRKALAAFGPEDMLRLMEAVGLELEEREHGQMFCRKGAEHLRDALVNLATGSGARLLLDQQVGMPIALNEPNEPDGARFSLISSGKEYRCRNLVVATGGLAWPSAGGSGFGHRIARQFGHGVQQPLPALSPLKFKDKCPLFGLQGLSLEVMSSLWLEPEGRAGGRVGGQAVKVVGVPEFSLPLLFTHGGVSGPAILQISSYWRAGLKVGLDFLPGHDLEAQLDTEGSRLTLRGLLRSKLPERLVEALLAAAELADVGPRRIAELSRAQRVRVVQGVKRYLLDPQPPGFAAAESSSGGVLPADISAESLQSRLQPGLYFVGEVLDVCGQLGGYNLHWAWSSAWLAAASS